MLKFKKLQDKFATKEQAKRQDILVWGKHFWKACRWFYKKGKKDAKVVPYFPRCVWQGIAELTESHGTVLGRCGNVFSLIVKETCSFDTGIETSIVSIETGEVFDAREFMVIPLNNRTEIEVSYSAKGLVLGIIWEGVEGTYPLRKIAPCGSRSELQVVLNTFLQTKSLTGTDDFSKELGAVLVITKTTTIQVKDKPFVNTEVSREFIGDLTAEQMEELDNMVYW